MQSRRGFTLLELLIVIAVIGILATLLLGALSSAKKSAQKGVAKSHINAIKAALAAYHSDHGRYPRIAPRPATTGAIADTNGYMDDCVALWVGLMNKPTQQHGGGQNSPYLSDWKVEYIGLVPGGMAGAAVRNGGMPSPNPGGLIAGVDFLPATLYDAIRTAPEQANRHPTAGGQPAIVLMDPWGNPYHYREWASISTRLKETAMLGGTPRAIVQAAALDPALQGLGNAPIPGPANDQPHNLDTFDIWSNGPNGINEYGDPLSDDVTSWTR